MHFTVLVFSDGSKTLEEILLKFDETAEREEGAEGWFFEEDADYDEDPTTGRKGQWQNENAQFDWYVVGGRWKNSLKTTDGDFVDSALVRDWIPEDKDGFPFVPYALVNVDGEWLSGSEIERVLPVADPGWTVTLVDCHV